jgi:arylsulfatase A
MKRSRSLLYALLTVSAIVTPAAQADRPVVIFILADDLGWAESGCYGNSFNETPHLDRLAQEGMRLTHAINLAVR